MTDSYDISEPAPGIHRIELPMAGDLPESVARPTNVYLLAGESPALINAGHPNQFEPLSKAVREAGVEIAEIARILHTSWSIRVLGGAKNFPGVDHFVFSPDMAQPHDYQSVVDDRRRELSEFGESLLELDLFADADGGELEAFLDRYYPPVTRELDFVPVRRGHVLQAGRFELEVVAAPGPEPGHVALFDPRNERLFTGAISLEGMPDEIYEVQSYFVSIERLIELEPEMVLPNSGEARDRGAWTLQCAHRFVNNFMSNAPEAMYGEPTLVEFARRDMGRMPENFAEAVLKLR
ncbi:MAG: MBL fold metallo-hydrolase, partial [Bradymonadaceae bacterium]